MKNLLRSDSTQRRGMLILLVLGMLTTFLMLGALMLVLATRSRLTARAFSSAASSASSSAMQTNALLDEALMILIRGTKARNPPTGLATSESILEDKYGDPVQGKVAAGIAPVPLSSGANDSPILQATVQGLSPAPSHACELNGRVLTLKPDPGDGDAASYRILRATGSGNAFVCYLAKSPFNRSRKLPKNSCTAYVNGREFSPQATTSKNEPYDAFDVDTWLARVQLGNSIVTAVPQPSYADSNNLAPVVDNDNDGVADGVWVPQAMPSAAADQRILPDLPSPLGGSLHFQVSYHVIDLDSRINVNAHGGLAAVNVQPADWSGSPAIQPGLGYGTADIDASKVVADPPGGTAPTSTPVNGSVRWQNIVQGGTPSPVQKAPGADQRRPTPALGALEGRYCDGMPGMQNTNDPASAVFELCLAGNSPSDLQGRVKAYMQAGGVVPTLTFFRPDWTSADTLDDPYELRLDSDAPRGSSLKNPSGQSSCPGDNPFTLGELERILRQYDTDAAALPPRLASLLDDYAQRSRCTITTDSWDTPALTGDAMARLDTAMRQFPAPTSPITVSPPSSNAVYNVLSPDVTAGLRLDVNRPLRSQANQAELPPLKQQYLQHVFTLLMALDPSNKQSTAAEKAQWAVNVLDFRDADSTMTKFAYDEAPFDGWSPNNERVIFGAERPEVIITETLAYGSSLFVVLHHPWKAAMVDKAGNSTDAERIDPNLQGTTANSLELRKKPAGCNASVWRLRLNTAGTVFRFADLPNDATTAQCMMAPNMSLCVGTGTVTALPSVTATGFNPTGSTSKVYLERLADPTKEYEDDTASVNYNPYVMVDQANIVVYPDVSSAQKTVRLSTRSFWRQSFAVQPGTTPAPPTATADWFHWPNRPFISAAELALVPNGDASTMLLNYDPQRVNSLAANPASLILDAVHVPSRFAGSSVKIGDDNLLSYLAGNEKVATTLLPTWREPGRVNLNTILPNGGNTSNSSLDDAVWKTFIGTNAVATNPFAVGGTASAKSTSKMLSLNANESPVQPPYVENTAAPRDKNPAFSYATAIRLANTGTIRSNVFAVWITLKVKDDSPGAPPDFYRRIFAIVDRSIPAGFSKGENLTARDVIRLERYLE